jgi:hypothetical protein
LNAHSKKSPDNKWDSKKCTILEQTDAFSMPDKLLRFTGFKSKKAKVISKKRFASFICFQNYMFYYFSKFIRIENETKPRDLLELFYNKNLEGWKLNRPSLIISVTGLKKFGS